MSESTGDTSKAERRERPFDIVDVDVSREQVRTLEVTFSALCTFDHDQPDRYTLSAVYRSQNEAIETDSFAEWVEGFEDEEWSAEALAAEVYDTLRVEFGRSNAEVTLYQQSESQVTLTVEMGSCA